MNFAAKQLLHLPALCRPVVATGLTLTLALPLVLSLLLGALLPAGSAQARLLEYTQSETGDGKLALGYPVPVPVESVLPVDGFRSYSSLTSRHQSIALANDAVTAQRIGTTIEGRPIWAYVVSDEDGTLARGDGTEPAALINGNIHAREWASPEVVTAVLEQLDSGAGNGGFEQYLIENVTTVIVPVLNPDGLVHTQRTPALVVESTAAGDPPSGYPRDGRMRRKNKNGADDDVRTEADALEGVDLNRNNDPFYASSARSSSRPDSIVYHGISAASERETRALQAAAALGPEARLRFYVDTHSFSRIFFGNNTFNNRRNRITNRLIARMGSAAGGYGYSPSPAGTGIGSTDEYFSYTYEIPSYTLEIEPTPQGGVDYGGHGVSHDGFILPESEIRRVRDTLAPTLLLGVYHQAGPPAVERVEIRNSANAVVFSGQWISNGGGRRELSADRNAPLEPDASYSVTIAFDKPMRHRNTSGQIAQYPGQNIALAPTVALSGVDANGNAFRRALNISAANWQRASAHRYADDTVAFPMSTEGLAALVNAQRVALEVSTTDLAGQALDAFPGTPIDWRSGGWAGYEDSNGSASTDIGGTDRSMRIVDDGSPLFDGGGGGNAAPPGGGGSSGALSIWVLLAAWMMAILPKRCRRIL